MKLEQLASKPQLLKIEITDEAIQKKYGESLTFYVYDRQDIQTFAKMATIQPDDFASAAEIVSDLIRDEKGAQICKGDVVLPTDIMMKVVAKVVEELGKLVSTELETKTPN